MINVHACLIEVFFAVFFFSPSVIYFAVVNVFFLLFFCFHFTKVEKVKEVRDEAKRTEGSQTVVEMCDKFLLTKQQALSLNK